MSAARPAVRLARPALIVVPALLTAVLAVLAATGGDEPDLVLRAVVRVVLELAAAAVLGGVLAAATERSSALRSRFLDVAAGAAAVQTLAAATTAFLLHLAQAPDPAAPSFGPGLIAFLGEVAVGRAWLAAVVGSAVLTAVLVAVRSRTGARFALAAAVVVLVPVVLQAAPPGASLVAARTAIGAEAVRLLATGAWAGLLALVVVRSARPGRRLVATCVALGAAAVVGAFAAALTVPEGVATPLVALRVVVLLIALGCSAGMLVRHGRSLPRTAGALVGVALGLSSAASLVRALPVPADRTTPAELLTGAPLPPAGAAALATSWAPDPLWLVLAAAVLVTGPLLVVLGRAGWSAPRAVAWAAGGLLLAWLTSGAPAVRAPLLLSAWLVQHAALLAAVPALLVLGAPVPRGGRRPVPLGPARAAALAGGGLLLLLLPPVLRWSVADPVGADWSVLQCLGTGAVLAIALRWGPSRRARLAAAVLLLLTAAAAAWGATSSGLLLADWFGAMGWGTDARVDQRTGALAAWALLAAPLAVLVLLPRRSVAVEPVREPRVVEAAA